MGNIVNVENVYKSFQNDKVSVLDNINLSIEQGEFVSLMGASGSGKSTLLYLVGGLDKPTSGTIKIDDKDINKMKDSEISKLRRKEIGFIFQFYNLVQNLTVEENIMLPVIMEGLKRKDFEKQLNEILEIVGLTNKRKSLPNELSGGQQQRVAIARFKKINKEKNITILQVTHSEETAKYGDRIIYLKDGKIV